MASDKQNSNSIPDIDEDFLMSSLSTGVSKTSTSQKGTSKGEEPNKEANPSVTNETPGTDKEVTPPSPPKENKPKRKKALSDEDELEFILTNEAKLEKLENAKLSADKLNKIRKYVTFLGSKGVSIQSYIDNVLEAHFRTHEEELNRRIREQI